MIWCWVLRDWKYEKMKRWKWKGENEKDEDKL